MTFPDGCRPILYAPSRAALLVAFSGDNPEHPQWVPCSHAEAIAFGRELGQRIALAPLNCHLHHPMWLIYDQVDRSDRSEAEKLRDMIREYWIPFE